MPLKIACVLNPSQEYGTDYVERLLDGIADQLGRFEFVCIHSKRWPGWWSKMELFDHEIKGDLLYFDLDTVIVGPIDDLFTGALTVLTDFTTPHLMATGVMFIPEWERAAIWREWMRNPQGHMAAHRGHGDGGFLSKFWKHKALRWQDTVPGQIVSYKVHCKEGVPANAKVVCFHGRPRPRDVDWRVEPSRDLCRTP